MIKEEQDIEVSPKRLTKVLVDLHSFDRQYIKLKLLVIKMYLKSLVPETAKSEKMQNGDNVGK